MENKREFDSNAVKDWLEKHKCPLLADFFDLAEWIFDQDTKALEMKDARIKELQWFADKINSHVCPGESDTSDAALELFKEREARIKELEEEALGQRCRAIDWDQNYHKSQAQVQVMKAALEKIEPESNTTTAKVLRFLAREALAQVEGMK